MLRALIWKEWREQRPLVLAAVVAAFALPLFILMGSLGTFRGDSLTQVLPALNMIVLLPVFAAATGALCFADDRSDNTLGFLLSRPASRNRVWLVKVGVALTAFGAIVVLSIGVSMLLAWLAGGPTLTDLVPRRGSFPLGVRPLGGEGVRGFVVQALSTPGRGWLPGLLAYYLTSPACWLLLFGASAFWSTRQDRPLKAMFAGLATTAALIALQVFFSLIGAQASSIRIYILWPHLAAVTLLIASYLLFRTTEPAGSG